MFDSFPYLETNSFDEAQAIHSDWDLDLCLREKLSSQQAMHTVANVYESPLMGLYGYRYEKSVTLNALASNPDYWVSVMHSDTQDWICRPASPGDDDPMELHGGQSMLGIRLNGAAVNASIESYIGEALVQPIRFKAETRNSGPADQFIGRNLTGLSHMSSPEIQLATGAARAERLIETYVENLLLFRDHTHRAYVRKAALAPSPRDVRLALDFIHAYAADTPTLADIAAVAGVPGRTLSLHFNRFVGASPVAYVNRVRLQSARDVLERGLVGSVAAAAASQGFVHMGRFAEIYTKAFGESPSHTLRHARTGRHRVV